MLPSIFIKYLVALEVVEEVVDLEEDEVVIVVVEVVVVVLEAEDGVVVETMDIHKVVQ